MTDNNQTREAWNATATVWDEKMGDEGNDFHKYLVRLAIENLLQLKPGQNILDVGCGNGLTTRRLASLGAKMVGIDFASEMINNARKRTAYNQELIEYQVLDATDETALLKLGENSFDACKIATVIKVSHLYKSKNHKRFKFVKTALVIVAPSFQGEGDLIKIGTINVH